MMRTVQRTLVLMFAAAGAAHGQTQGAASKEGKAAPPVARAQAPAKTPPDRQPVANETPAQAKVRLQKEFRQQLGLTVRTQLALGPEQMKKLMSADVAYEQQRRPIVTEYNQTIALERRALRSHQPDSDALLTSLDSHARQLHSRLDDLDSAQQKQLSGFLSPAQRIKFNSIRQNLQKMIEQQVVPPDTGFKKPPQR